MAVVVSLAPGDPRDPKGRWSLEYDSEDDVPEELRPGGSKPPPDIQVSRPNFYEVNVGGLISPVHKDKQGHSEQVQVRMPDWLKDAMGKVMASPTTPHVSMNHYIIDALAKMTKVWAEHAKLEQIPQNVMMREAVFAQEQLMERMATERQWSDNLETMFLQAWNNQEYGFLRTMLEGERERHAKLDEPTSVTARRAMETIVKYEGMLSSIIG